MKITKIEIENLLSFGEKQSIEVDKFNLFVGPNNEGKSNVLKSVQFLDIIFQFYNSRPVSHLLRRELSDDDFKVIETLGFLKEERDIFYKQDFKRGISFCIGLIFSDKELNDIFSKKFLRETRDNFLKAFFDLNKGESIEIRGKLIKDEGKYFIEITRILFSEIKLRYNCSLLFDSTERKVVDIGAGAVNANNFRTKISYLNNYDDFERHVSSQIGSVMISFFIQIKGIFSNNLKLIPSVRTIEEFSYVGNNHQEFSKVTEKLMKLRDGVLEDRKKFLEIKNFVRKLAYSKIPESELDRVELIFPRSEGENGKHLLKLNIDDNILPLSQLGSGVEQLVYLAVEILVEKNGTIFLIEEPEMNFHAKLQRSFLKFLQDDLGDRDYQFFIISHSSVLIDPFMQSEHANVFQVKMNKSKEMSEVIPINANSLTDLFFELGIRGADIMQANGVIWVEGPSDRVYILKWLELYNKKYSLSEFKEGQDFSILFYGGSILSSFGLKEEDISDTELKKEEDDFINILKINRNAIVLMDRDEESGKKWETKERIVKESNTLLVDNGFAWITEGKEIENYLTKKVIERVFPDEIKPDYQINEKVQAFEKWFKRGKGKLYKSSKKKFANKIVTEMTWQDIKDNSKLEEKLGKLHNMIKTWNQ